MYETEEEQIEAIKKWWNRNGNTVIGAVLAVVIAYFGWTFYQGSVQSKQEAASALYGNLQTLIESEDSTPEERASLIDTLKSEYAGTAYAVYGALQGAKDAVEQGDLTGALAQLNWAEQNADATLLPVVKVRKARVLFADGQFDAALATLDSLQAEGFGVVVDELRGDILAEQGKLEAAHAAYQSAYDQAQEEGINSPYLKMKLDDLAVSMGDA